MESPTPAAEKKPLFDTVIISTPVLLTVVATFILGRSTAEMTQAQYHRAVAGQNQSKVGDQWAFFQAKRIRGNIYEATAISLLAQKADPFTADTLLDASQALIKEIQLTEKAAPKLHDSLQALDKKAQSALGQVKAALNPPKEGLKIKRAVLTPENVKTALAALETYPEGKVEKDADADKEIDAEQRDLLDKILEDIRKFKPESAIVPKALKLEEDALQKALTSAKAHAAKVAERGKAIDVVLGEFDALVDRQAALAREYLRIVGNMAKNGDPDGEMAGKLRKSQEQVRTVSAKLLGDYKAARYAFDARRYEDDARSNQDEAYLYDVKVYLASARSDRALKRSFGFMIAMLIAQVGVTIASLAMAFKYKLPVWFIAVLAGFCAIMLGAYVFLEMGPLMW